MQFQEWLAAQVLLVAGDLKGFRDVDRSKGKIGEQLEQRLFQLVHEFTDVADICLLVLHLEVRTNIPPYFLFLFLCP